jgi:CD80-like C2-set immunoglobulin domain
MGGNARYSIGDVVNMTCKSERSSPAANLSWYINGELVSFSSRTWTMILQDLLTGCVFVKT